MYRERESTRVLVVDDEENIRHYLQLLLQHEGFEVITASQAMEALEQISAHSPDIILCDIRMPGNMNGLELLKKINQMSISSQVVMMSAYGSRDTALEAVRLGAYDYIDKPIQRDELILTLRKLLERERLRHENVRLRAALEKTEDDHIIVARSDSMKRVLEMAKKVAVFPSTVLIQGASGTGKELLARGIHRWSDRHEKPFIAVNCGSIPENLLESELFGHARGSFTGAHKAHKGLFEAADEGTLFLDEIGELPLSLQVKLLRVLQEGKIRRIGETFAREVDVRIIAATNIDLTEAVEEKKFRQDLYYRLQVVTLTLPSLKDRTGDIPLLLDSFIGQFNSRFGTDIEGIEPEAMKCLTSYDWPGNIRQLKNVVERAIILEKGKLLSYNMLPDELKEPKVTSVSPTLPPDCLSIKKATRLIEEELITRALKKTGGNRSAAARLLEISHRALLYKIKQYEISL